MVGLLRAAEAVRRSVRATELALLASRAIRGELRVFGWSEAYEGVLLVIEGT